MESYFDFKIVFMNKSNFISYRVCLRNLNVQSTIPLIYLSIYEYFLAKCKKSLKNWTSSKIIKLTIILKMYYSPIT